MRFLKVTWALALVLAALTQASCVKMEVDEHSYQFNEASGSLGLKLLLLNAVRASKDYPLQFSKISAYQGTGSVSGSVSANLPVGPTPLSAFSTAQPRVDYKNGINQLTLQDLNTEEAQQALKRTITPETFRYYWIMRGGRNIGVINAVLLETVFVHDDLYKALMTGMRRTCTPAAAEGGAGSPFSAAQRQQFYYMCVKLREIEARCPEVFKPDLAVLQRVPFRLLQTKLTTECASKQLTVAGLLFMVMGFDVAPVARKAHDDGGQQQGSETFDPRVDPARISCNVGNGRGAAGTGPKASKRKDAGGNVFNIYAVDQKDKSGEDIGSKYDYAYRFADPYVNSVICGIERSGQRAIQVVFRSPERMVRYMGELIAAQNYRNPPFVPTSVDIDTGEEFALLRVVRGTGGPGGSVVSITDPEGNSFYVPKPEYGSSARHRSMELLAMVSDVFNGAVSKKSLPQVTTLSLTPAP